MCGFAGFYNLTPKQFTVDETLLDRMQRRIAHRGPEASKIWKSDRHQLGLAFRRLKIIDLSDASNQPMHDEKHGVILCFNGEIYNHQELRQELEGLGYHYRTTSDTETIIYAYRAWGIASLSRFEGMFAIALFDTIKNKLFLVRDRMGVKPLYFSLQGGVLSFASEIKALWELPWMEKRVSQLAWYHYLTFMVSPAPLTIFEEVYKLPAGFYAEIDAHKQVSFREWYNPVTQISTAEQKEYASEDFCIERIGQLLIESTKKRMIADVPVGAYLSGGLDSSLNVALMSRFNSKIKTFTVAFADSLANNELSWARTVAQEFGTDHHEMIISEHDAINFYEQMVDHLDEPLADCVCIPFYYVSKMACDAGMKVVQVGEGADELFFGYPAYGRYVQFYNRFWRPTSVLMPTSMRKGLRYMARPFTTAKPLRDELLANWAGGRSLFWGGALAFGEEQKRLLFDIKNYSAYDPIVDQIYPGMQQRFDSYAIVDYHRGQLESRYPQADFYQQMMYLELKQRLPELLLMRADKMSMAASIEAREPYLDHKLVEFMFHVPGSLKFKNNTTKYLLKKAAEKILPDSIIYRKKVGFSAPTAHWFEQGSFFPAYFDRLAQQTNGMLHASQLKINGVSNSNQEHRAVQNWVLQQMWAFMQLM